MATSPILDQFGRPIEYAKLTAELAAPSMTGVRQVWHPTVADGLTPERLAGVLHAAAEGNAYDYLTLAEEMEERDLHYSSVLGTRKQALSGLSIRIDSATDDADDIRRADVLREIVDDAAFGELQSDMTDALGKGYSVSEIMWDRSGGVWTPERFEHRDPRFFQFDRITGRELRLLDESAPIDGLPLAPYKFIVHYPRIRSGLPIRGGLARLAAVGYMCKAWTWKDWMAFADIFGIPMRVGRYGPGASVADIETLMSAVANLGADAGAVIPESMRIEFQQAAQVSGAAGFFQGLAEWWDKQISKGILGQTMTADDGSSLSQARIHEEVRLDLLKSDAKVLSNTLQRYFIQPFCDLNFGQERKYPRLVVVVPEPEDTAALVNALEVLVPMGLRVEQSVIRDKLGLPDPDEGAELLHAPGQQPAVAAALTQAANTEQPKAPAVPRSTVPDDQTDNLERAAAAPVAAMIDQIKELVDSASSLEDLRDRMIEVFPDLTAADLGAVMAEALLAANLAGRADILRGV